ncbi:RNA polymerase sigma factor [Streptomyces triticiradicis]|uniref:Sigma-70 family RNA polymerase sigma factor n=1 Tax=Streptomyces triticiradicis TaxID=2651189 RepID=A0A7J5DB21_9ACTN|nr:sigma-70 family RNA polymerase sigma factor [Streptomyces triticiradicis]KAB1985990.1 sigma-70 family RNA polymerase sigma factor [Streptomyces triticiradicis]
MDGAEPIRGGPAAAARDPRLFEAFYRSHVDAVTRFVARRVDDPHTAADLTAEIFLAALDSAHTYRPALGSERAWLYGIARNVVSSERRRVAREAERDLRFRGRRLLDADDIVRLEDKLDAESPGRRVLAALARLPEGERAVMELIAVDQLTVTEAAAALGIRQVTARVRLHRARKALRVEADSRAPEQGAAAVRASGGPSRERTSNAALLYVKRGEA